MTATATLTRMPGAGEPEQSEQDRAKNTVAIQFAPSSLKLSRQGTQSKAGSTTRSQAVQYPSVQPASLSLELEFDTAEDFSDAGLPVDVRTRTDPLRGFLEPPAKEPAKAPPRALLKWGNFQFLGIVTALSEEFDYFSPDGTPLRAKIGLTLQEQDPKLEASQRGPGARGDSMATDPGGVSRLVPSGSGPPPPGSAPGRSGTAFPESTLAALAGESAQQLAVRAGGDPAAWRSLMNGIEAPTGLVAGLPVQIGPELAAGPGLGVAAGFGVAAGADAGQAPARALGLGPRTPGGAAEPPQTRAGAGFALSAAGGIEAAARAVRAGAAAAAQAGARNGFEVPAPGPPDPAAGSDRRASTYGHALPLRARARVRTADDAAAGGVRAVAARARPAEVVPAGGPVPPWERLPAGSPDRASADAAQRARIGRRRLPRRPGDAPGRTIGCGTTGPGGCQ